MRTTLTVLACAVLLGFARSATAGEVRHQYLSPAVLAVAPDQTTVFVACSTAGEVIAVDLPTRKIKQRYKVAASPSGLAVTPDGQRLLVTCAGPRSTLEVVDPATGQKLSSIALGHTAMAPVLSQDAKCAYVCYRFENCVGVIDLELKKEVGRIPVTREPVAAALSSDGKHLLVANHLHSGPGNADSAAPSVTVIDCASGKVIKELPLPSGTTAVQDLRISPDGKHAVLTHIVARFQVPAAQLERGWMNTNAKTIIDLEQMEMMGTVLLDGVDSGAANPWGIGWTADGARVVIAHSGTHELSVIDFPDVLRKIKIRQSELRSGRNAAEQAALEPVNDLAFLTDCRTRVRLAPGDLGPRGVVVAGNLAVSANYFSDSLSILDLSQPNARVETLRLGSAANMDEVRLGELYFHDASICFQTWQSCASCHPGEGRADALNWDLLNDGLGNPKNTKSLLLSHRTPPAMSMGVRDTAEAAVRAGIRNILMTVQPDKVARSIDAYLKSLQPVPSPKLIEGKLSAAALRGERVFKKAGCIVCHPKERLWTDLDRYDVGTRSGQDRVAEQFDTPTLIEVWRTAPYLHDGSAATIRDVLTTRNPDDQHGGTSKLSEKELDDLCEFVLSL